MAIAARPLVLADALVPRGWAQTRAQRIAVDVVLMFGFAWFVALFAQMAIRLPWTTVPITGQTFAVLVTGGALGANRGAGSLVMYMLMGMVGIPVFAPGSEALAMDGTWGAHFLFPWVGSASLPWAISSGGYIVGFILAAWVTGYFAERSWDRKSLGLLAMLAGNVILYVPGLLWLYYLISTGWTIPGTELVLAEVISGDGYWSKTLVGGLYPFIVGDLMKLYLATLTLPAAWALVRKIRGDSGGGTPNE
jgi:biotin transport system substrate-specific component